MRIYRAYSSGGSFPAFERNLSAVEKNLEVAFKQAKTPEGKVDLEDTYAISRLEKYSKFTRDPVHIIFGINFC
jgi:hypothetical protein